MLAYIVIFGLFLLLYVLSIKFIGTYYTSAKIRVYRENKPNWESMFFFPASTTIAWVRSIDVNYQIPLFYRSDETGYLDTGLMETMNTYFWLPIMVFNIFLFIVFFLPHICIATTVRLANFIAYLFNYFHGMNFHNWITSKPCKK